MSVWLIRLLSCFLVSFINTHHFCFEIKVVVNDAGKTEIDEFDVVHREIPPFEVPQANPVKTFAEPMWDAVQDLQFLRNDGSHLDSVAGSPEDFASVKADSEVPGKPRRRLRENTRVKRSQPDKWCNVAESFSRAVTVAKGDMVHLPCHKCVNKTDLLYESMQWVKFHPNPDRNNLYIVKEISSDMHDDEKRNNLIVNLKHTLIIRKTRKSDTGGYICKPSTTEQIGKRRMNWTELQTWIAGASQTRYFYHLDVLDLDNIQTVETGTGSKLKSLQPNEMVQENLLIYTKWLPWSGCSLCGQIGMRQRLGLCVVKKRNFAQKVPHTYLNNILDFAKHGLPCKSEYLKEFDGRGWLDRPNEIEFAECFERCPKNTLRRKRSIFVEEMSRSDEKEMKNRKVISVIVNDYLVLKCPGSKLLKKPVWMLGSKTISQIHIRKITHKRISFDVIGSLHFIRTKINDTGMYSCWIEKKLIKKFDVRVHESQLKDVIKYGKLLGLTLVADFIIFLCLTITKSCLRCFLLRKKPKNRHSRLKEDIVKE